MVIRTPVRQVYADPWDGVFYEISREHWRSRKGKLPPLLFVRELVEAFCELSEKQQLITAEAIGGEWHPPSTMHMRRGGDFAGSRKQQLCEMVAERFRHLGPFEVAATMGGEAAIFYA